MLALEIFSSRLVVVAVDSIIVNYSYQQELDSNKYSNKETGFTKVKGRRKEQSIISERSTSSPHRNKPTAIGQLI